MLRADARAKKAKACQQELSWAVSSLLAACFHRT
jgi:hypothetical protein